MYNNQEKFKTSVVVKPQAIRLYALIQWNGQATDPPTLSNNFFTGNLLRQEQIKKLSLFFLSSKYLSPVREPESRDEMLLILRRVCAPHIRPPSLQGIELTVFFFLSI